MPQITSINPHQKRRGLYSIFLDAKFAFSLSELQLSSAGLKVGQNLSAQEVEKLEESYHSSKCYNSALRYLSIRARSTKEVEDYLTRRKGYDPETVVGVVDRLLDQRYLDDSDFARIWVENRMRLKPKPKSILRAELLQKGIDREVIDSALAGIDEEGELESITKIVLQKSTQSKYKDPKKMAQLLASRGYSHSLIKKAFERVNFY